MINRVSQSYSGLQGLESNRSPKADPRQTGAGSLFRQAMEQEVQAPQATRRPAESDRAPRPEPQWEGRPETTDRPIQPQMQSRVQPQLMTQLQPLIHEVRQIAEANGYVGVTSQDVLRAYQTGQSFLADYRV